MIPVLFQDRELVVCCKPAGLLSQDGPGETLPSLLRTQLGGDIFPVHRLDREEGGRRRRKGLTGTCCSTTRAGTRALWYGGCGAA